MRVGYLTGQRIHLRPPIEEDKECATAWYRSVFPINASRATVFLEDQTFPFWQASEFTFIIARMEDDVVVGSVNLGVSDWRMVTVRIHMAPTLPDADELRAEAIRMVIPWLRDEHEFMVVRLFVPANETETIAAIEGIGMRLGARLREFIATPGGRVDELAYEALNPRWEVPHA
ncbi:MAG TPA: GNAT family protein [Nitrolancea sp.]|nr:GNAT family protein [Nitrolancea sp.]